MKTMLNFLFIDAMSLKAAFGWRMLIVFAVLSITGYTSMGVGGIFYGAVFVISVICIQPFTEGADGLDRFYSTLFLSRKDVVVGRYFFVLVVMALVTMFYFAMGTVLPLVLGTGLTFEHLPMMFGVYLVANLIMSVLLPILFKMGFKKARPLAQLLPLLTILVVALLNISTNEGIESNISEFLGRFDALPNFALPLILTFVCLAIFAASLALSIKFYAKREF